MGISVRRVDKGGVIFLSNLQELREILSEGRKIAVKVFSGA